MVVAIAAQGRMTERAGMSGLAVPVSNDLNAGAVARLPGREQATQIEWGPAIARSKGIYGFDSIDARSRSFNLMRSRLLDHKRDRGWRMIGVVSATPNVGKSFIAANLSAALSRVPTLETYVLDMDLRRASLTNLFGIPEQLGLHDYLTGTPEMASPPAVTLEGERLVIFPTRAGSLHSAELLAGEKAQRLFRMLRAAGDDRLCIFDLPPVFANDDASTVMASLDGYVLVAEEGKTTQRELADAVALLGRERLAGVILNKYRGGLLNEGYGVDNYYASGYSSLSD